MISPWPHRMMRLATAIAALVCIATAEVEAVHLYNKGSFLHEQATHGVHAPSRQPQWRHVLAVSSAADFHQTANREPLALVFFYTPWSQSSIDFYDDLESIAEALLRETPSVPVIAVNLRDAPELGQQFRINSFPTFLAFRYGTLAPIVENQFPRVSKAILRHVQDLLKPAVDEVASVSELDKLVDRANGFAPIAAARVDLSPTAMNLPHPEDLVERTIVVGFLQDPNDQTAFIHAARLVSAHFRLVLVADASIASAYSRSIGSVVVYRRWGSGEPIEMPRSGPLTPVLLAKFLVYSAVAPLGMFDDLSRPLYMQRHKPLLIYFSPKRLVPSDPWYAGLAAAHLDESLNVTVTQTDPNEGGKLVSHFVGLDSTIHSKQWAIGLLIGRKKFRFDTDLDPTEANIRQFINSAVSAKWPEFHRSEPRSVTYPAGSGHVSDLAYVDFEDVVISDTAKDVIILMYDPTDRSCRDLMPVYEALAESLRGVQGVVVGRMNVMQNDYHDAYAIPGVPSILYGKRSAKRRPVRMTSVARTVDNMRQFIADNAAVSLGTFSPSNQTPSARPVPSDVRSEEL